MEFIARVRGDGIRETAVAVSAEGNPSGRELVAAIADHIGTRHDEATWWWARTGTRLVDVVDLSSLEPRDGDLIICGADRAPGGHVSEADSAVLEVVRGRDTGRTFDLRDRETVLGRGRGPGARLADDSVSRSHCRFTVDGGRLVLEDLGSTNGTRRNGVRLNGSVALDDGDRIEVGETELLVRLPQTVVAPVAAEARWAEGAVLLNRPPRVIVPPPGERFDLPTPPDQAQRRPFPWLMVLLPLIPGAIMIALGLAADGKNNAAMFGGVAFMLMSPVMMAGNYFTDRKQGGRNAASERADYERRFAAIGERLTAAVNAARAQRTAAAPEPAAIAEWCTALASRLWERRPRDPDFLTLRVGVADQPSLLEVIVPDAGRNVDTDDVERARALAASARTDPAVPALVSLDEVGALGVHGAFADTAAVLRALTLQVVGLHSPADVAIVAVVPGGAEEEWGWLSWLPHSTQLGDPSQRSVAATDDADNLLEVVELTIKAREAALEKHASVAVRSPRLVLLLPEADLLPAARLGRILDRGPAVGVLAIAAAGSAAALPGQCGAVLELGPRHADLVTTRTAHRIGTVSPDRVDLEVIAEAAVALAPVRDPAASRSGAVPRTATCEDIALFDMTDPIAVQRRWEIADPTVSAPIGLTGGGVHSVSLRKDGPHGVVAGTTGAGKSEFLQTLIASLAAHNSPQRLALVLVDLKGGAAFQDLSRLPHTVGFFTDLDEHLAVRALTSLNAELRRREEVLRAAGVKDLIDMEATGRADTPPSLLIVFDEFAVLKTEMPDFIEGIVDIARRGRSLGVHMILATQSPTGVVDHHIRANTNLRVALRTANAQESQEIIERNDAAEIPRDVHGRAWVRVGQDEPVLVQTAYTGRRASTGDEAPEVRVAPFGLGGVVRTGRGPTVEGTGLSDAQRIIEACIAAAELARIAPGPPPWLPPLPPVVRSSDFAEPTRDLGGLVVPVGVLDDPTRQAQDAFELDLAHDGNLAVFGASGSGKTTAVRTLAAGIAERYGPETAQFVVLDFASRGLRGLGALPHTLAYVTADDPGLLDRVLARLDLEIASRRRVIAEAGHATLSEARASGDLPDLPFIVAFLDGLAAFVAQYQETDLGLVLDQFTRIATEGRSAGVFVVVTVDRRAGLTMALGSAISERLVLRMVEDDDYIWLGVPEARDLDPGPGRAVLPGGRELQIAVAGGVTAAEQQAAIDVLGATGVPGPAKISPDPVLPDLTGIDVAPAIALGVDALTDQLVTVNLDADPLFLVAGPDRSGRSSTLRALAEAWVRAHPGRPTFLVAPRRTVLTDLRWDAVARDVEDVGGTVSAVLAAASDGPVLLVVDDGDQLGDGGFGSPLDDLMKRARDLPIAVVAAATSHAVLRAFSGWLRDIRNPKMGLLLEPDPDRDSEIFGGRLPRRSQRAFPPGRGYLVRGTEFRYIQVGMSGGQEP